MQHELRMNQLESDIVRLRSESEQIKSESERIKNETVQIENETVQIENETELLKVENARQRALSALIRQQCFPPACNSSPATSTEPDSRPSSP